MLILLIKPLPQALNSSFNKHHKPGTFFEVAWKSKNGWALKTTAVEANYAILKSEQKYFKVIKR